MMTPIGDAWAAPQPATKKALQRASTTASATKIPFVDYDGEAADVDHYCKTYGVMCQKAGGAANRQEAFEGLTEDEINDVFVAAGRPQVEASFQQSPQSTQSPQSAQTQQQQQQQQQQSVAALTMVAPRDPSPEASDDGWAWLKQLVHTDDFFNLALFAVAGLLLVIILDQMVRIGIEISRARIGMAVALRNAAQVTAQVAM